MLSLIDQKILAIYQQYVDTELEEPLVCLKFDKINTKNKKDKKQILLATTGIFILQRNKKVKYGTPRKIAWTSLLTTSFSSHKSIIFRFTEEKFEIFHKEYNKIGRIVKTHLFSFLKEQELPIFSFQNDLDFDNNIPFNPFYRFCNIITSKVKYVTNESMKRYKHFFQSEERTLALSFFEEVANDLETFFDCIYGFKQITALKIDISISDSLLSIIITFLKFTKTINTIIFSSKINIGQVPSDLIISKSIQNFSCIDVPLNPLLIRFLSTIISINSFNSVSFTNTFHGTQFNEFISQLNPSKPIKSFSLVNSRDIKFDAFYYISKELESLTISGYTIDISVVFCNINHFPNLKTLNLSNNQANIPLDEKIILPENLQEIIVNEIKWKEARLIEMLKLFEQLKNPITLSLNNSTFASYTWDDFYEDMLILNPINIINLNWDGNRINQQFTKFIRKFPNLKRLSVFNCLKLNAQSVYSIAKYIVKSKYLNWMNISINNGEIQEAEASSLFNSLSDNRSLRSLSMLGYKYTKYFFDLLINALLDNRRITELEYDFIGVNNEEFTVFLDKLSVRGPPLKIDRKFVERFLTSNDVIEKYNKLINGDKSIEPPEETVTTDIDDYDLSGKIIKFAREKARLSILGDVSSTSSPTKSSPHKNSHSSEKNESPKKNTVVKEPTSPSEKEESPKKNTEEKESPSQDKNENLLKNTEMKEQTPPAEEKQSPIKNTVAKEQTPAVEKTEIPIKAIPKEQTDEKIKEPEIKKASSIDNSSNEIKSVPFDFGLKSASSGEVSPISSAILKPIPTLESNSTSSSEVNSISSSETSSFGSNKLKPILASEVHPITPNEDKPKPSNEMKPISPHEVQPISSLQQGPFSPSEKRPISQMNIERKSSANYIDSKSRIPIPGFKPLSAQSSIPVFTPTPDEVSSLSLSNILQPTRKVSSFDMKSVEVPNTFEISDPQPPNFGNLKMPPKLNSTSDQEDEEEDYDENNEKISSLSPIDDTNQQKLSSLQSSSSSDSVGKFGSFQPKISSLETSDDDESPIRLPMSNNRKTRAFSFFAELPNSPAARKPPQQPQVNFTKRGSDVRPFSPRNRALTFFESSNSSEKSLYEQFQEIGSEQRQLFHQGKNNNNSVMPKKPQNTFNQQHIVPFVLSPSRTRMSDSSLQNKIGRFVLMNKNNSESMFQDKSILSPRNDSKNDKKPMFTNEFQSPGDNRIKGRKQIDSLRDFESDALASQYYQDEVKSLYSAFSKKGSRSSLAVGENDILSGDEEECEGLKVDQMQYHTAENNIADAQTMFSIDKLIEAIRNE